MKTFRNNNINRTKIVFNRPDENNEKFSNVNEKKRPSTLEPQVGQKVSPRVIRTVYSIVLHPKMETIVYGNVTRAI